MQINPILLFLTCSSHDEASRITRSLLNARAIVCVKWLPTTSYFLWKGAQEQATEWLLIMETIQEKYEEIYGLVKQEHSYETFVLQATPVSHVSTSMREWMAQELDL